MNSWRRWFTPAVIQWAGLLFSLVSVLVLVVLLRTTGVRDLLDPIASANFGWLGIALVLALIVEVLKAARWQLLLGGQGSFPVLLSTLLTSRLMNALTPVRAGDLWRVAAAARGDERPLVAAGGSVVAEKVLDGAVLGAISVALVGASGFKLPLTLVLAVVLLVGAAGFFVLEARLPAQVRLRLKRWVGPLGYLRDRRLLFATALLTLGGMAAGTLVNLAVLQALRLPLGLSAGAIMLLGGYAAGLVPAGPGRLAVFEVAVAGPLASSGIAPASSLLAAVGLHVVLLASLAAGGLVALPLGLTHKFVPAVQPATAPET